MVEVPCSCIGTLTIVDQEETPQVESLLPVSLGPIYDGDTPSIRIYINNSRISIRVIMTWFRCSLYYWYNMHMVLPNDTSAGNDMVPASKTLYIIGKKKKKNC